MVDSMMCCLFSGCQETRVQATSNIATHRDDQHYSTSFLQLAIEDNASFQSVHGHDAHLKLRKVLQGALVPNKSCAVSAMLGVASDCQSAVGLHLHNSRGFLERSHECSTWNDQPSGLIGASACLNMNGRQIRAHVDVSRLHHQQGQFLALFPEVSAPGSIQNLLQIDRSVGDGRGPRAVLHQLMQLSTHQHVWQQSHRKSTALSTEVMEMDSVKRKRKKKMNKHKWKKRSKFLRRQTKASRGAKK